MHQWPRGRQASSNRAAVDASTRQALCAAHCKLVRGSAGTVPCSERGETAAGLLRVLHASPAQNLCRYEVRGMHDGERAGRRAIRSVPNNICDALCLLSELVYAPPALLNLAVSMHMAVPSAHAAAAHRAGREA